MTTIAANLESMAADSMASDNFADIPVTKIRVYGKSIFGGCGDLVAITRFFRWVDDGMPKKLPKDRRYDGPFSVMELNESGLFLWENAYIRFRCERPFHATGAGGQAAVALMMHAGMSPAEAVDASCDVVPSACARPIDVVYLKDVVNTHKPSKKKRAKPL